MTPRERERRIVASGERESATKNRALDRETASILSFTTRARAHVHPHARSRGDEKRSTTEKRKHLHSLGSLGRECRGALTTAARSRASAIFGAARARSASASLNFARTCVCAPRENENRTIYVRRAAAICASPSPCFFRFFVCLSLAHSPPLFLFRSIATFQFQPTDTCLTIKISPITARVRLPRPKKNNGSELVLELDLSRFISPIFSTRLLSIKVP